MNYTYIVTLLAVNMFLMSDRSFYYLKQQRLFKGGKKGQFSSVSIFYFSFPLMERIKELLEMTLAVLGDQN